MKLWVLVYEEHYIKFCFQNNLTENDELFQRFLKEIGTPAIMFQEPNQKQESNYMVYKEVPSGSCIRFHTPEIYARVIRQNLYIDSNEKQDKSRRTSSCSIV